MVVGTKRVASSYVEEFGQKTGMPYISHRWLGGMLTNWKTIKVPINKLLEYEENKSSGQLENMIKKEAVMLEKEMKKLSLVFDGVKDMKGLPDAIFVIDVENEKIAVQEAQKMGIPVYGLVDTNSNPKNLTNFIPINDDSSRTIKFVLDLLSEAILEGQDSARKQGLVQKLDGDKGPKVFSLNSSTKKVSVDAPEEVDEKVETAAEEPAEKVEEAKAEEKAEEKVYSELGRLNKLKIKNPNIKIGVGGCVASQEGKNIKKRAPFVDLIYGPQTLHRVSDLLDEKKSINAIDITFPIEEKFDSLPEPSSAGPTSFVSIMEGCSKYCSFCVVPYLSLIHISEPTRPY